MKSKVMWIAYVTIKGKKYYDYNSIRERRKGVKEYLTDLTKTWASSYKICSAVVTIEPI